MGCRSTASPRTASSWAPCTWTYSAGGWSVPGCLPCMAVCLQNLQDQSLKGVPSPVQACGIIRLQARLLALMVTHYLSQHETIIYPTCYGAGDHIFSTTDVSR